MAAPQPLHPGGRHGDPLPVQRLHRAPGQASPLQGRRPLHGCHQGSQGFVSRKVPPQRTPWDGPRGLQGGDHRCKAVSLIRFLAFDTQLRKQRQQAVHHKGRAQLRAGHVRRGIADHQSRLGLDQSGVKVLELNAHLFHAAGRQADAPQGQFLPVIVVENAAALTHSGQHMVIGPQQEQVGIRVTVVPGDLRDGHLVQGHGDGAHAVLGGHLPQQAAEFVGLHGLVPQDLHELVQDGAEDLPQLGGLLRVLEAPRLRLEAHLFLQRVLEIQTLQETVKSIYFLPGCNVCFQPLIQLRKGRAHPAAQIVHPVQTGLAAVVPRCAVTVRIVGPVHIPEPHLPVDLPGENVVFQLVALLRRQTRQAGLQPAEHVLVLKAVFQSGEDAGDETPHGLFQHAAPAAQIGGNAVPLEYRLDGALVVGHVPGGHGDVPVAALPRRHQAADVRRRLLHLGKGGVRLPDPDGGAVSLVGLPLSEEVMLQIPQGGVVGAGERPDLPGAARLVRQPRQLVPCAERDLKHLLGAVRLPQQRHRQRPGLPQQNLQHPPLLGVEVGEAVQKHVLAESVAGGLQRLAELGHPVPGVKAGAVQPGLIGAVQQTQIQ